MTNVEKSIEKSSAIKRRNQNIQRAILGSISAVGILSISLFAPNSLKALKSFGLDSSKRQKEKIARARDVLLKKGLLQKDTRGFLSLTKIGETRLRLLELREKRLNSQKHWDKRWRVLIFDIPENRKSTREKLRLTLTNVGFVRLQDSVWIYPYDCEEFVALMKADFKIGYDMLYLIVEEIEGVQRIKDLFGIKSS